MTRIVHIGFVFLVLAGCFLGCKDASSGHASQRSQSNQRSQASYTNHTSLWPLSVSPSESFLVAGADCRGARDCQESLVCVAGRCRFLATSVAGEVLASAAEAQVQAGDITQAHETYLAALKKYEEASVPMPSDVLCRAASNAFLMPLEDGSKESAARLADRCFRHSLPGDRARKDVLALVAQLRYEGLALHAFDAETPPSAFFTEKHSRPSVDAIQIAIDMPSPATMDERGYDEIHAQMMNEASRRAISDCFIQDWELRHERSAQASLMLRFSTKLRDMGSYDTYTSEVQIQPISAAQDGFGPCVAQALRTVLDKGPRMNRTASWQTPFGVSTQLR